MKSSEVVRTDDLVRRLLEHAAYYDRDAYQGDTAAGDIIHAADTITTLMAALSHAEQEREWLETVVSWMEADLSCNGQGTSDGYRIRLDEARAALARFDAARAALREVGR